MHSHPLLVRAGIAPSCPWTCRCCHLSWALWSGAFIMTPKKVIHVVSYRLIVLVTVLHHLWSWCYSKKKRLKKAFVYWNTKKAHNLKRSYLTRVFFLFIDTCVCGAVNLSAFCAQHQFLLDFYFFTFLTVICCLLVVMFIMNRCCLVDLNF